MIVAEPRTQSLNGTTQAGPDLKRAVRNYVGAYVSLHGRRKAAEHLGVSRHTLWRFLERGQVGRAVPSAVLSSVGKSVGAIKAATFEIIIDLEDLRPDPGLCHLPQDATARGDEGLAALVRDDPEDDTITGYLIERKDLEQGGGFTTLVEDTGNTDTGYTDRSVEPGGRYAYRVKALNDFGRAILRTRWMWRSPAGMRTPVRPSSGSRR